MAEHQIVLYLNNRKKKHFMMNFTRESTCLHVFLTWFQCLLKFNKQYAITSRAASSGEQSGLQRVRRPNRGYITYNELMLTTLKRSSNARHRS